VKPTLARARELLAKAPGPSPWYLPWNRPALDSRRGPLAWAQCRTASALRDPEGKARLILGSYCYTLALKPGRLLIWHGPRRGVAPASTSVDFYVVHVDELDVITDPEQATRLLEQHGMPFVAFSESTEAIEKILSLSAGPPGGTLPVLPPEEFDGLKELLFFVHAEDTRLWSLRPADGLVDVMPQNWFDRGDFDFDYQWPTRAARDEATGALVGDGIRIGTFVLDETGRNLAVWLDRYA
jgi:hypothetical protein